MAKFTEENVAREMAKALDVDEDDLVIDEDDLFGEDTFTVELGRQEYRVVANDDVAEAIALAAVTEDLENEPEIFTPSFIESHIDMKALKSWVYDAQMEDDYAYDIAQEDSERFWEEAKRWGIDVPDEDDDGEMPDDVDDEYPEALQQAMAADRAEDPMGFFEDIYGKGEATKYAIEAVGIDIEAAAEDAVGTDGWQHFLARYDGNSQETSSGFVYWREN
jgi:hypothetical protein